MTPTTIKIQPTSNDTIVKFEADRFLTQHNSYEFNNIDEASNSPLAQQLFYLPFVKKVYIASNFVAIERYNIVEWADVQDEVAEQIKNYLNSDAPIVKEETSKPKNAVTVYAESTPNPSVLKFVCNKALVGQICEFSSIDEAKDAPMATALFQFPFVKSVFMDKNYISITKYDVAEWEEITTPLREFIKSYVEDGKSILAKPISQQKEVQEEKTESTFEKLDDTSKNIVNILEEYVKPAVASDGGNIEFISYDDTSKKVEVLLQGACSGCPSSTFTLKNGIENMLKEMLNDQNITVNAVNG
ncbi:Fe-S cluster biogenesis protein NfuA [Winogradskyella wandonensis]|uniref:Fe-S cluster biogenesis protein NfuA n=1 Tax=Winogradskyella wandonensis TaxID=1442586 RepID=A0A4R1KR57_9FLAO|nr:NifU family protein [Winogradskyella wandonensis]TCK67545.1 Fe-S cluster biogenesis protein NfuA [Winogradskyella wandonensis]